MKRIKSSDNLTKEHLIISFLKSESNPVERNYINYFNNSTNDDTYDNKIKVKVNYIRIILTRLENIVTKNDRKKIKKELYEIEKKQNLSDREKEEIYDHLVEYASKLYFLLKIQEKLVVFLCGVIMKKLGQVMKQMILLKDFLILS